MRTKMTSCGRLWSRNLISVIRNALVSLSLNCYEFRTLLRRDYASVKFFWYLERRYFFSVFRNPGWHGIFSTRRGRQFKNLQVRRCICNVFAARKTFVRLGKQRISVRVVIVSANRSGWNCVDSVFGGCSKCSSDSFGYFWCVCNCRINFFGFWRCCCQQRTGWCDVCWRYFISVPYSLFSPAFPCPAVHFRHSAEGP